jgi:hypothetical protein
MTKAIDQKEKLKRAVTRVNTQDTLAPLKHLSDKANKDTRKGGGYVPVERHPDAALPPKINIWSEGTYRTGDGDVVQSVRPGSMDAYGLPSKGIGA